MISWGRLASRTAGKRLDMPLPVFRITENSIKLGWIVLKPGPAIAEAIGM